MVWEIVIVPVLDPELREVLTDKVIGCANEILAPVVVSVPPRLTEPAPFCVKAPVREVLDPAVNVRRPAFVTVNAPLLVVIRLPLMLKILPTSCAPPVPLVLIFP